jgi:hypothetical protein
MQGAMYRHTSETFPIGRRTLCQLTPHVPLFPVVPLRKRVMSTGVVSLHLSSGILELQDDARARSRAVASKTIAAGSVILSDSYLAAVLLPSEKGRRCDTCYRMSKDKALRKCSGCASYWYCDTNCTSRGKEGGQRS